LLTFGFSCPSLTAKLLEGQPTLFPLVDRPSLHQLASQASLFGVI
jgi:hypothetical protein